VALLALGLAATEPILLVVALALLAAELPLDWLVAARHRSRSAALLRASRMTSGVELSAAKASGASARG
jgi:hypothetical protein